MSDNETKKQTIRALLTLKELHGEDEAIRFLEQELLSMQVAKERRNPQRALVPYEKRDEAKPASTDLTELIRSIEEALNFYANADHYEGAGRSQVQRDRGERARDALTKIAGEDRGD